MLEKKMLIPQQSSNEMDNKCSSMKTKDSPMGAQFQKQNGTTTQTLSCCPSLYLNLE
jgi:hypothetical protein